MKTSEMNWWISFSSVFADVFWEDYELIVWAIAGYFISKADVSMELSWNP